MDADLEDHQKAALEVEKMEELDQSINGKNQMHLQALKYQEENQANAVTQAFLLHHQELTSQQAFLEKVEALLVKQKTQDQELVVADGTAEEQETVMVDQDREDQVGFSQKRITNDGMQAIHLMQINSWLTAHIICDQQKLFQATSKFQSRMDQEMKKVI